ncbi:MAG: hypothetical protein NVSMB23_13710 [Myxococcales bacterium]
MQPGDGVRLAVEAPPDFLARVQVRVQHLDRDRPPQLGVEGAPDDGHAALADLRIEAIPSEDGRCHATI